MQRDGWMTGVIENDNEKKLIMEFKLFNSMTENKFLRLR